MTDCAELRPLVEKLHDFEATAAEKLAAESHLDECPGCRGHLEFLKTVSEESRSMKVHEPPESYWDHLPGRILGRIDSEGRRPSGFLSLLLAPPVLRWAGLGATLVLVAAVGVSLLREEPGASGPPASVALRDSSSPAIEETPVPQEPDTPAAAPPEAQARSNEAAEAPPPMARDETAEIEPPPAPEEPAAPESFVVLSQSEDEAQAAKTTESEPESEPKFERSSEVATLTANRARAAAAPDRLARVAIENCEAIRREADSLGETREGVDAKYRLALCSLNGHEQVGTEQLQTQAVEDAEAFLELEPEGTRADEVRALLRRIKPN